MIATDVVSKILPPIIASENNGYRNLLFGYPHGKDNVSIVLPFVATGARTGLVLPLK
ncbi:MAG: hypothetical protein JWQ49_1894 [Edaphobacter sp.]|nr:hypothetical protein [Edaphobacter sp.]